MGWMYYYDYYFLILVVPALLISLAAQIMVKTTFSKQSKKLSAREATNGTSINRTYTTSAGRINAMKDFLVCFIIFAPSEVCRCNLHRQNIVGIICRCCKSPAQ